MYLTKPFRLSMDNVTMEHGPQYNLTRFITVNNHIGCFLTDFNDLGTLFLNSQYIKLYVYNVFHLATVVRLIKTKDFKCEDIFSFLNVRSYVFHVFFLIFGCGH